MKVSKVRVRRFQLRLLKNFDQICSVHLKRWLAGSHYCGNVPYLLRTRRDSVGCANPVYRPVTLLKTLTRVLMFFMTREEIAPRRSMLVISASFRETLRRRVAASVHKMLHELSCSGMRR